VGRTRKSTGNPANRELVIVASRKGKERQGRAGALARRCAATRQRDDVYWTTAQSTMALTWTFVSVVLRLLRKFTRHPDTVLSTGDDMVTPSCCDELLASS
jgi:hypothetical protein